jgi:hypothetical protein
MALLPLQLVGAVGRPITDLMWLPMLAFELVLALWLILKGAAMPQTAAVTRPGGR